jgi:glycosyltransferase involved in cell wall biosynthesis
VILANFMKIAHIVDSLDIGGAETLVSQMCRLQREQGDDPSVLAWASLGTLGEQMRGEGFAVHADVGKHLLDSTRNFYRIFKELRPDAVHLHNPTPTIYAAVAARMAGVPSIISTRHSLVAPPRRRIEELKYAGAACFCDWVVGICDATVNNLKAIRSAPARKIVRVYNGATPLKRVAKEGWPPKSGFTLVYVGRMESVKNHALLLRAFQAALSTMPELRLWLVGDGGERETTMRLAVDLGIAERVTFWGQQLDVAPFFSAADVFVMSSRSEGLPISLLQAFSLGVPAIVTDVGGMSEVVKLSQAGYTVSATDSAEMAAAMLQMASSEATQAKFSANAKVAFNAHFTLQITFDAYMELYRKTPRNRREATGGTRQSGASSIPL